VVGQLKINFLKGFEEKGFDRGEMIFWKASIAIGRKPTTIEKRKGGLQ